MSTGNGKRLVAGVAIVGIVACGVWLALSDTDAAEISSPRGDHRRDARPEADAPVDQGQGPIDSARFPGDPGEERSARPDTDPAAVIEVKTVEEDGARPVADVNVWFAAAEDGREAARRVRRWKKAHGATSLKTDRDGSVRFPVPANLALNIYTAIPVPFPTARTVKVERLPAGSVQRLRIEVPSMEPPPFFGRVVAAGTTTPIPDARITVFSHSGISSSNRPARGAPIECNGDGLFELDRLEWRRKNGRVSAPGFSDRLFSLPLGHESPQDAFVIEMPKAAAVEVRVSHPSKGSLAGLEVWITTSAFRLSYPDGSFVHGEDQEWRSKLSAEGRATVADLPPGAPLTVRLLDGTRVVRRRAEDVLLSPGETRRLDIRIGEGATITGTLLDEGGAPVEGVDVWLVSQSETAADGVQRYFRSFERANTVTRARTGKDGRFTMQDVPAGSWWIGPAAYDEHRTRNRRPPAVSPLAIAVTLAPTDQARDVLLHAHRNLTISGRVLLPNGEARGSTVVWVRAASDDRGGFFQSRVGADGGFSVGPLSPGPFRVSAHAGGPYAPSETITVDAGAEDLTLTLRAAGTLVCRVIDERTGDPIRAPCEIIVSDPPHLNIHTGTARDVRRINGITPGTYDITAVTAKLVGTRRAVRIEPDKETTITIAVSPAARLRVRYEGPDRYADVTVLSGGAVVAMDAVRSGASATHVVPTGPLEVVLTPRGTKKRHARRVDARAGDNSELVFDLR